MKNNGLLRFKITLILALVLLFSGLYAGVGYGAGPGVERIAGQDRYETSARVALEAFGNADRVILSRGDEEGEFADGLAASVLAGVLEAPILLTRQDSLPGAIESAIIELNPEEVVILGGEVAVSPKVEEVLKDKDLHINRIAGENRMETAALIAQRAREEGELSKYAFVVDGHAPADSLAAGPAAYGNNMPILQVSTYRLPSVTREALDNLDIEKIYLVGGPAVVGESVEQELSELAPLERLAGKDRFATSVEVARALFPGAVDFSLVGGFNYADAIGAAVFENPVLYVNSLPAVIEEYLGKGLTSVSHIRIFGGEAAASPAAEEAVKVKMAQLKEKEDSGEEESGGEELIPEVSKEGLKAEVTGDVVNIRSGPGLDYSRLGQVTRGTQLSLTGRTGDWYQIQMPQGEEEKAWIAGWLIEKIASSEPEEEKEVDEEEDEKEDIEEDKEEDPKKVPDFSVPDYSQDSLLNSAFRTALVMKAGVNVRSAPSAESSIVGRVNYGDWLDILEEEGGWYRVSIKGGKEGWIASWLVATRYDSPQLEKSPVLKNEEGYLLNSWEGGNPGDFSKDKPVITDIQIKELERGVKLEINANSSLDLPRVLRLNSPSRLAFDFSGYISGMEDMSQDMITIQVNSSPVTGIRASQFDEEKVRIVADLQEDMVHSAIKKNDGKTVEIFFRPVFPLEKTVFIDPGHGTLRSGNTTDPGAVGPSGLTERDVVMSISRKTGEILLNKGYSVVFARENVTSLHNGERGQAASICGGVFVSIHANAHLYEEVQGTETFYPGTRNGASEAHINASMDLATRIQEELVPSLQRPDRGVKQANFEVLRNSQVPAALTEVAFISNPQEEKLLMEEDFQMKAAQAIASGINNYFQNNK